VARGYSEKRIASFVGIVPADAPRAVILVVIDEPKTDVFGGLVAAPAFKEIATAALPYLGVSGAASASKFQQPSPVTLAGAALEPQVFDPGRLVGQGAPGTSRVQRGSPIRPDPGARQ